MRFAPTGNLHITKRRTEVNKRAARGRQNEERWIFRQRAGRSKMEYLQTVAGALRLFVLGGGYDVDADTRDGF